MRSLARAVASYVQSMYAGGGHEAHAIVCMQVVYKKLMGCKPTLDDLEDCNPQLARGLKMLLEFEGDVEEVTMAVFTCVVSRELPQATSASSSRMPASLSRDIAPVADVCAVNGGELRGIWLCEDAAAQARGRRHCCDQRESRRVRAAVHQVPP